MSSELSDLLSMDRDSLGQRWHKVFGNPAPINSREELLRQALGWKLQADAQGGLSGAHRRQLRNGPSSTLAVGSHLIRVWQGETHQVTVLESGFAYDGKYWKSLSAIARAITGTAWSGPVFFGIKK